MKREDIAKEMEEARMHGYNEGRGYSGKQTERDLMRLQENVRAFEEATGLAIDTWRGKEWHAALGKYVKAAMNLTDHSLQYDIDAMQRCIGSLQKALGEVNKVKSEMGNSHE